MHRFLRSIGFSSIEKRAQWNEVVKEVVTQPDEKHIFEQYGDGLYVEFVKYYADQCGIAVCGQLEENNTFHVDYSYPFYVDEKVTSTEEIQIEKETEKDAFIGSCDDYRIGVTLIFSLQETIKHMTFLQYPEEKQKSYDKELSLTGMASCGIIILPLDKDKEAVKVDKDELKARTDLIHAAMDGDEEAIESLTIEDMDTYSMIAERITKDDIFTIIDSYFKPDGLECERYGIMGEILDIHYCTNKRTDETIVQLLISCNDMEFHICVNKKDLLGEPVIGRRFKGSIWLQGRINYKEKKKEIQN